MSRKIFSITVVSESFLLAGSGEGSALIDADIVYHASGFPMLPARRIKGLLKESVQEIMEIMGLEDGAIDAGLVNLFGKSGNERPTGKLQFNNLYIHDWDIIKTGFETKLKEQPFALSPDNIRRYFTTEVQQTALDNEGIAKHRSLRNYRVLNPGYSFSGSINIIGELTEKEEKWLQLATDNLRYAGTRRNRGFGKIRCALALNEENAVSKQSSGFQIKSDNYLKVTLKTQSPVVLAIKQGDQNTEFTEKMFTGNRLLGALASAYIQAHPEISWEDAHSSDKSLFREIFLTGKVQFCECTFEGSGPIPFNIHRFKGQKDWSLVDVFRKDAILTENNQLAESENITTRPVRGFGSYGTELIKKEAGTTFNFHHSRTNRAAGKSTDAEIFYYESLNEGQCFEGYIKGDVALINNLLAVLDIDSTEKKLLLHIGRSRSAQYGKVEIQFYEEKITTDSLTVTANTNYLLIALSPIILRNKYGFFEANITTLQKALGGISLKIENAATRTREIEQYKATWQAKSGKLPAFDAGSTFAILTDTGIPEFPTSIGEWQEQGFGRIKVIKQEDFPKTIEYKDNTSLTENNSSSSAAEVESNNILKSIIEDYEKKQQELNLKANASKDSFKWEGLNNNLLSRLLLLITRETGFEGVKMELDNMSEKTAGKAIKTQEGELWDKLYNSFTLPEATNNEDRQTTFMEQQLYWKNLFITARKKKKYKDD